MLFKAVNIDEVSDIQQDYGKAGLLGSHILYERNFRAGECIGKNTAEHIDEHGEAIAFMTAHGTDTVCDMRIGGRIAVVIVGPIWRHLLVLTAIGLNLADGDTAGGNINHDRAIGILGGAAENDGVRSDQAICAAERGLAWIGVAYDDSDYIIVCHAVTIVSAAANVCAVTCNARRNAIFAGPFEHGVIYPVHSNDAGASTAVKNERGILVLYTAKVGLCHQCACYILPQIDAETG